MNVYAVNTLPKCGHGYCFLKEKWTQMSIEHLANRVLLNASLNFFDHQDELKGKERSRFDAFYERHAKELQTVRHTLETMEDNKLIFQEYCRNKPSE